MTLYEARYYTELPNHLNLNYLGAYGGKTSFTINEIINDHPLELFDEIYVEGNKLSLYHNIDISEKKYYTCFHFEENKLILNILFLSNEPQVKILDCHKVNPPNITPKYLFGIKVNAYCYDLTLGSQFVNYTVIFIDLLNHYLKNCTDDEHINLLNGRKYLRFMLHQNDPYSDPYAYGYLRNINTCSEEHQSVLNSCPDNYLPAEMNMLDRGFFLFIDKRKWIDRSQMTQDDILTVIEED